MCVVTLVAYTQYRFGTVVWISHFPKIAFLKSFRTLCITELMAFHVTYSITTTRINHTHSPKADIDNFNFSNYFNAFSAFVDTFNSKQQTINVVHEWNGDSHSHNGKEWEGLREWMWEFDDCVSCVLNENYVSKKDDLNKNLSHLKPSK